MTGKGHLAPEPFLLSSTTQGPHSCHTLVPLSPAFPSQGHRRTQQPVSLGCTCLENISPGRGHAWQHGEWGPQWTRAPDRARSPDVSSESQFSGWGGVGLRGPHTCPGRSPLCKWAGEPICPSVQVVWICEGDLCGDATTLRQAACPSQPHGWEHTAAHMMSPQPARSECGQPRAFCVACCSLGCCWEPGGQPQWPEARGLSAWSRAASPRLSQYTGLLERDMPRPPTLTRVEAVPRNTHAGPGPRSPTVL